MMSNRVSFRSIVISALLSLSLPITAFSEGVFLRTAQPVDDDFRGYCIDVAGYGENINLDAALRVHTCKYGVEGNEDMLFEWIAPDRVRMSEYDVCIAANEISEGEELFVQSCSGVEEQSWALTPEGMLTPTSRPDLCLTLADERRPAGAPSWLSPVYHAREISLESCDKSIQARQQLRWAIGTEQELSYANQVGDDMPPDLAAAIKRVTEEGVASSATSPLYANQARVYELEELEVVENLAYGPHERHVLDVHTDRFRRSDVPLMPVVMYFHGGGFVRGNRSASRNVSDYFASLGLVGVNATYRLAPEAKWPDGANDIGAAVAWVKDNISEYGGDPNQIFVVGKSAAAAHAATYVFRPDVLEPGTPAAAGVIMVSGTYGANTTNPSEGRIAYFGDDFSRWPEISTTGNVERVDIPVMFSVSEFDNPGTQASLVKLMGEVTEKQNGRMPRVIQLIGHNHYSPNPSIGTQDTQLSSAILEFVRSTAAARQRMTAR